MKEAVTKAIPAEYPKITLTQEDFDGAFQK